MMYQFPILKWGLALLVSFLIAKTLSLVLSASKGCADTKAGALLRCQSWWQGDRVARLRFRQVEETESSPHMPHSLSKTWSFKILQLADLHLGEEESTDWGPKQDLKTWDVLDAVLTSEPNVDLIVLSGDQLTANNIDANATAYHALLCRRLSYYGVPWATIFGNHDDAPLERVLSNGTRIYIPPKTSRQDLIRVDRQFPLSMTQHSQGQGLFGTSNYRLNVHWKDEEQVGLQIFFLDTGGGSLPQQLQTSQLQWLESTNDETIPALAFQHIPSRTADFGFKNNQCEGFHDDGVSPLSSDPGILGTLQRNGNFHVLAVGHDHGNDYCCRHCSGDHKEQPSSSCVHVCFGRHSGYGGYGTWDRGARVYEFTIRQDLTNNAAAEDGPLHFEWSSWVRMEDKTIVDTYNPNVRVATNE